MTDPNACQQPGCTGTIIDGYCDVRDARLVRPALATSRLSLRWSRPSRRRLRRVRAPVPNCRRPFAPGGAGVQSNPDAPARSWTATAMSAAPERASEATPGAMGRESPVGGTASKVSPRLDATALASPGALRVARSPRVYLRPPPRGCGRLIGAGVTRRSRRFRDRRLVGCPENPGRPGGQAFLSCDEPVGRGRDGSQGGRLGSCANRRAPFDFTPKLRGRPLSPGR